MTILTIKWLFWGCFGIYIAYRAYNKYQDEFNPSNREGIQKEVETYLESDDQKF